MKSKSGFEKVLLRKISETTSSETLTPEIGPGNRKNEFRQRLDVQLVGAETRKIRIHEDREVELLENGKIRLFCEGENRLRESDAKEKLRNGVQRNLDPGNRHILNFHQKSGNIAFWIFLKTPVKS